MSTLRVGELDVGLHYIIASAVVLMIVTSHHRYQLIVKLILLVFAFVPWLLHLQSDLRCFPSSLALRYMPHVVSSTTLAISLMLGGTCIFLPTVRNKFMKMKISTHGLSSF